MSDAWYYACNGQSVGPVSMATLLTTVRERGISQDTQVWQQGMNTWRPLFEVAQFLNIDLPSPEPKAPPIPPRPAPPAVARPADATASAAPWAATVSTAGQAFRRFGARMLDLCVVGFGIMMAANYTAGFVVGTYAALTNAPEIVDSLMNLLTVVSGEVGSIIQMIFFASLVSVIGLGTTGYTLGKWLFGVRITGNDGRSLGLGWALRREIDVLAIGNAFYLPVVSLFAWYSGWSRLQRNQPTSWDEKEQASATYRTNGDQVLLVIVGCILMAAACYEMYQVLGVAASATD